MEVWFKLWCPKCETANWLCDGDPSDCTGVDIEACTCHNCKHSWWLCDEEERLYLFPEGAEPKDHADEGLPNP